MKANKIIRLRNFWRCWVCVLFFFFVSSSLAHDIKSKIFFFRKTTRNIHLQLLLLHVNAERLTNSTTMMTALWQIRNKFSLIFFPNSFRVTKFGDASAHTRTDAQSMLLPMPLLLLGIIRCYIFHLPIVIFPMVLSRWLRVCAVYGLCVCLSVPPYIRYRIESNETFVWNVLG